MLRKWNPPTTQCFMAENVSEAGDDGDEVITGNDCEVAEQPVLNDELRQDQTVALQALLGEYPDVLQSTAGRTNMTEHTIETGSTKPIRLPPYRLPHAYREIVRKKLRDMEEGDIIEPSTSDWAAPIVLVKKKDGTRVSAWTTGN